MPKFFLNKGTVDQVRYEEVRGIKAIVADDPNWPNPANIYIIADDEGFSLIDAGCGGSVGLQHLLVGLEKWNLPLKRLHTIVLSHSHPDHMGSLGSILEETKPKVFIHSLDSETALNPRKLEKTFDIPFAVNCWSEHRQDDTFRGFDLLKFFEDFTCPMSAALDLTVVEDGEFLQLGEFTFETIHTPGHSPGHIALVDKNKKIILPGDLLGKAPAWYTPSSGGVVGYLESLRKLEPVNAEIALPSHGLSIENVAGSIDRIRAKLMEREGILLDALADGRKSLMELNEILFQNSLLHFFPGCAVTESHLIKLEQESKIKREGWWVEGF
jgi:glyoxylase-like metal-dependent hydrolase (beta-lactamase superfamily II)